MLGSGRSASMVWTPPQQAAPGEVLEVRVEHHRLPVGQRDGAARQRQRQARPADAGRAELEPSEGSIQRGEWPVAWTLRAELIARVEPPVVDGEADGLDLLPAGEVRQLLCGEAAARMAVAGEDERVAWQPEGRVQEPAELQGGVVDARRLLRAFVARELGHEAPVDVGRLHLEEVRQDPGPAHAPAPQGGSTASLVVTRGAVSTPASPSNTG